jgi:hypothetical protein
MIPNAALECDLQPAIIMAQLTRNKKTRRGAAFAPRRVSQINLASCRTIRVTCVSRFVRRIPNVSQGLPHKYCTIVFDPKIETHGC